MIHLGKDVNTGKEIEIPVHHTGTFGMTGVGKTKLLKYMLSQADKEGFQVLIFDSKVTGAEFEYIGKEIPFYLEQNTDADIVISLLESIRERRGNFQWARGGVIKVVEGCKNFQEVQNSLEKKLKDKKIHGRTHDMYYELNHDFKALMQTIGSFHFSEKPEINGEKIYRMPTYRLPNLALQGLVVKSTIEWMLRHTSNFIVLIDEAPNFVSQKYYNPAKHSIQILDAQGRSKKIFGWYSGQNLTGFDKSNMKNLYYWALGRQKENNEVKDVYETLSQKIVKKDEIKTLPVQVFLVETPESTYEVKVPNVNEETLFHIASKKDEEEVYKEKFEELEKVFDQEKANHQADVQSLTEKIEELRASMKSSIPKAEVRIPEPITESKTEKKDTEIEVRQVGNIHLNVHLEKAETNESELRGQLAILILKGIIDAKGTMSKIQDAIKNAGFETAEKTEIQKELEWYTRNEFVEHTIRSDGTHFYQVTDHGKERIIRREIIRA